MNGENHLEALHGQEVEQSELEQLLLAHFGKSKAISLEQIEYHHRESDATAITMIYDAEEQLQAIYGGPALKGDDISFLEQKIRESLLTPGEQTVGRNILFAGVPTKSYFRYKDVFQLLPVPPEAPRPPYVLGEHPLSFEFYFAGSSDAVIRIQRRARIGHEIELVCVALLPLLNGSFGNTGRHHWVIPESPDPAQLKSEYRQEMYTWPQLAIETKGFTPIDGISSARRVPADEYYGRRGISVDQELDVPDNVEKSLDAFFSLDKDNRDRFLRASFWFRHAQRVFTYSQSASFTALVSAIEALMGPTPTSARCPTCGKSTGPGSTKLFTDFVDKYAPSPAIPNSARRELYRLRSKLSHGGHLLHSDHGTWGGSLSPANVSQWNDMDAMWQIVRVALINWLAAMH